MGVPGLAPCYPGLPSPRGRTRCTQPVPPDNRHRTEVMTSSTTRSDGRFAAAFRHNFYLSDEWARLFQAVTQYPVRNVAVGGVERCVVKEKLVGIANFSDEEA